MFECDLKPYCNEDCDKCEYKEEQLQRETLAAAVEAIKNEIIKHYEPFFDFLLRIVKLLEGFKDRRAAHLAAHSKKKRIRKKNMKRILKWIGKGGKDNGGN